jgi:hypothetical protein
MVAFVPMVSTPSAAAANQATLVQHVIQTLMNVIPILVRILEHAQMASTPTLAHVLVVSLAQTVR